MKSTRASFFYFVPVIALFFFVGCGNDGKKPRSPNIVATYAEGEITVESLQNFLKERTEGVKVLVGNSLVPIMASIPNTVEVYEGIIREIVLDEMVRRKIKEKQLDNRSNIRHSLKHVEDNITIQELHSEIHDREKIGVGEDEIQEYYEKNRDQFGTKPLYDVREQIKSTLVSGKEPDFVARFISELKDAATITKNYEILKVPEPTEEDVRTAYEKQMEMYRDPEKWVIEQIEIAGAKAKENAETALAKLGAGEAFEEVAKTFGKDGLFATLEHKSGSRGDAFDKAVASLNPGEFSRPIQAGQEYFLVRLKEKSPASYRPLDAVADEIYRSLMKEREEKAYTERRDLTLFTLHGRRYSLEDFSQEFKEMPPSEQERYGTYEDRVTLVDRMISRLLLLEDSYDRMLNAKKKQEIEHAREDVLKEVFHEEEVDQKLEVSDQEVMKFYEDNRRLFLSPPKVKVSIIAVERGESDLEDKKAQEKIEEAYKKLKPGLFKKGLPFEEVAKQYSEDPKTSQNGGQIDDWITESGNPFLEMHNHPFHERLMDLEPGEITAPFPIGGFYLIAKVRDKERSRQLSFEEVKEESREVVKAKKHDELVAKLYGDMIKQANLVIHEETLKSMIDKNKQKEVATNK